MFGFLITAERIRNSVVSLKEKEESLNSVVTLQSGNGPAENNLKLYYTRRKPLVSHFWKCQIHLQTRLVCKKKMEQIQK